MFSINNLKDLFSVWLSVYHIIVDEFKLTFLQHYVKTHLNAPDQQTAKTFTGLIMLVNDQLTNCIYRYLLPPSSKGFFVYTED